MIYTIVIFLSVVVSGFIFQWIRFKKMTPKSEVPFELTEFVQKTPTPTPKIEKKKRTKKPTTTK